MPKNEEIWSDLDWEDVKVSLYKYIKILVFSLLLPTWISIAINEGAVLLKFWSWLNQDVTFWHQRSNLIWTLIICLIPIAYLIWFYYLTIKKTLLQLHKDYFEKWFTELGKIIAHSLIEQHMNIKEAGSNIDFGFILIYINKKLSKLPRLLEWIARKVLDQIPFIEFINAYNHQDLEESNRENLAKGISTKINNFVMSQVNDMVPSWTKFIIPINILLLFYYMNI